MWRQDSLGSSAGSFPDSWSVIQRRGFSSVDFLQSSGAVHESVHVRAYGRIRLIVFVYAVRTPLQAELPVDFSHYLLFLMNPVAIVIPKVTVTTGCQLHLLLHWSSRTVHRLFHLLHSAAMYCSFSRDLDIRV